MAEESGFKIVNAYDPLVREQVRKVMEKTDMCQCEKCFLDICAVVFNKGYAKFVTTREGELFTKADNMKLSKAVGLTVAVTEAVERVRQNPMHE